MHLPSILLVSLIAGSAFGLSTLATRTIARRLLPGLGWLGGAPAAGRAAHGRLDRRLQQALSAIEQQTRLIQSQVADVLTDATTGIANRRAFDQELVHSFHRWESAGRRFALILIDLDHFKNVNDEFGHLVGDETLRSIALLVSRTVGSSGTAARYGGEELAVILADSNDEDAARWAQRIRVSIDDHQVRCGDVRVKVTASLGVTMSAPGDDRRKLLDRADQALYASKRAGRNCCHVRLRTDSRRIDSEPLPRSATDPEPETHPCVDALTGLSSRQVFDEVLRHRVAESRRCRSPVSVLLVQVDRFAEIQKRGPQAARLVLTQIARFLSASIREMDLVARYDHHSFAIVCPLTTLRDAVVPAERLRCGIAAAKLKHDSLALHPTVSLGLAELTGSEDSWALIGRARAALDAARANRTMVHRGGACLPVTGGRVPGRRAVRVPRAEGPRAIDESGFRLPAGEADSRG